MGDKTRIKIRSNDLNYNFPTNYFLVLGYEKTISKSLFGLGIWAIEIYDCSQIAKKVIFNAHAFMVNAFFLNFLFYLWRA